MTDNYQKEAAKESMPAFGRVLPKAEIQIAPVLMSVYGEMWFEAEADAS